MTSPMRQMPHDADAELAVIGSVLIDRQLAGTVDLRPEDFYIEQHADIWRAIQSLVSSGRVVDYVTLTSALDAGGKNDVTGLVARAIAGTVDSWHVQDYARIVREAASRRALVRLAGEMAGAAYDTKRDIADDRARWLSDLVTTARVKDGAGPIAAHASALSREIEERAKDPREIFGIPTGIMDWDRITHGLQPGEVVLLCGEPKMGKSMFAAQMFEGIGVNGNAAVYYALEMGGIAMVRRALSARTSIPGNRMRGGIIHDGEWDKINRGLAELSELPLYLSDATHWNTTSLRADVARLKSERNIAAVFVDHDGLLKDKGEDKNERDKLVSGAMHDIAKDFGVAVVAIHTMTKAGFGMSEPGLSAASGSVRFVYDADTICQLTAHKPQKGEQPVPNVRTLIFAAMREDDPDRIMHLVLRSVNEGGKPRGIPRLEPYSDGGF